MRRSVWRYFFKSGICIIMTFLYFAIPAFCFSFLGFKGMTGFLLLHTICRFSFYCCFCLVCISWYFLSAANRNSVKEVSESGGKKNIFEKYAFGLLLVMDILWNVCMIIILIATSLKQDGSDYFLLWFPENYFWNIVIPQIIVLLFTYLVASGQNFHRWIFAEIAFLFMCCPLTENVVWSEKPHVRIDLIWNKIRWIFSIFYQNGDWTPDYQNNLQLEEVRICVQLFWILLLLSAVLYQMNRKKFGLAVAAASAVILACSFRPASVSRLSLSWDGIYRDINSKKQIELKNEAADFHVTDYNLKLSFHDALSVSGSVDISSDSKRDAFTFTLYDGYRIRSLKSGTEGISVSYKRDGDFITVRTDREVKKFRLLLEYGGCSDKFYANSRAALLPGWFPWYPMPGKRQVTVIYPEYGNMKGYNPYNRSDEAHITIVSNRNIITNLGPDKGKHFEGTSDSITVLSGNIFTTGDSEILTFLPLELTADTRKETFIQNQKWEFSQTLEKMTALGFDVSSLQNKRVLLASEDMGRNFVNSDVSVFDNYILASPDSLTVNTMVHYILLEDTQNRDRRERSALLKMFTETNFDMSSQDIVDEWMREIEDRKADPDNYDDGGIAGQDMLLSALKNGNSERIVRAAVQYDLHPSDFEDDRSFIESISGEHRR